jgi:hypothetical protein
VVQLPEVPSIAKQSLFAGCIRLPIVLDADRLQAEVSALPEALWGNRGGRIGVHMAAEAIFLRGYAPAEGDLPIEDRESLRLLPYVSGFIHSMVPAPPMRSLIAKLPAGALIPAHVDRADYFSKTIRIHVPIVTNDRVAMFCGGKTYRMKVGEAWLLNNSAIHGVWNAHSSMSRTHLISDFIPSQPLLDLIKAGDPGLGEADPITEQMLVRRPDS